MYDERGRFRGVKVKKPRVPWSRRPPRHTGLNLISCGKFRYTSAKPISAQFAAAWTKKFCGPRRGARQFNPGGPESGTLAGARRAEGLFDSNWGVEVPLTRREREAIARGDEVVDPFFAPPTNADPTNWVRDKLEQLRQRQGPTKYTTASAISPLCGSPGSLMTCEGPNGGISWTKAGGNFTKEEAARFTETYCKPGPCIRPGSIAVPAGVTERVIIGKPANPAVSQRARCEKPVSVELNADELPLLPILGPNPGAEEPPPNCGPDIILGRDDGPFASGWWFVERCGQRLLVPNPLT